MLLSKHNSVSLTKLLLWLFFLCKTQQQVPFLANKLIKFTD